MKAKIIAVRAPEHLIDLCLKSDVDGVLCVLDHRIKNHEPTSIFQYPQHFSHHPFCIAKVVQAKRHKGPIESVRFKWQSTRLSSALIVSRNRIVVLVADVEHGEGLINTDDPAAPEALRHRPGHSTCTRRQIENLFVALQNEHFSQFFSEINADPRGSAIKLCRMLRVVEMSFVLAPVAMPVFVIVLMVMVVTMFATVSMFVIVRVLMPVFVVMFVTVLGFVIMLVAMLMFGTVIVFVVVLMFMFVFFAHGFVIPSNENRLIFAHLHRR